MRNDYRLLLTAMLDEAKSEKIIKQQLINIQNKSQISLNIKINEKTAKQQTHKLWDSLKKNILEQKISVKLDPKEVKKTLGQIDSLLDSSSNKNTKAINVSGNVKKQIAPLSNDNKSSVPIKYDSKVTNVDDLITKLSELDKAVKRGEYTWQDYSNTLGESNKWVAEWGKSTEGGIRTEEELKKAYDAAINYKSGLDQVSLGAKVGEVALKGLSMAGNMLASWAITAVIQLVVTAFDNFIHRVEIAKKALADAKSNFDSVQSEFIETNTVLENTLSRIKELENLPKLTFLEQEELDRLKDATKELERQRDINNFELIQSAEELSKKNMDAFKKEYGDNTFNYSDVLALEEDAGDLSSYRYSAEKLAYMGLEGTAAALIKVRKELNKPENKANPNNVTLYINDEKKYENSLKERLKTLQDYRNNLTTIMSFRDLTDDEQIFFDNLEQGMKLIYQFTNPDTWNNIEINDILDNNDLEISKNELIELYQAGKLNPETLKGYTILYKAIEDSQLIFDETGSAAESFIKGLSAFEIVEEPETPFSNTISQISSQLQPALDAVANAYNEIFTIDEDGNELFSQENINIDNLQSILDSLEEIKNEGASIDSSAFEDFVSVLSQSSVTAKEAHETFNQLATTITDNFGEISESNFDLAASTFESMGFVDGELMAFQKLLDNTDALAESGFNLADANDESMQAFINEHISLENAGTAFDLLTIKKIQYGNLSAISTADDIDSLYNLINTLGATSETLDALIAAKSRLGATGSDYVDTLRFKKDVYFALKYGKKDEPEKKDNDYDPQKAMPQNTSSVGKRSSGSPGKEAADATVTAFEEQYKKLKDIRDRDKINEKQYLDTLRAMYERYFKGNEKYIDEYNKYQKEYLDGMRDLYESVISDVVKQIDKQIDSLNDQKDAAVDSLKSQQEAAKEALEAQKDAIEEQIKLIDKQIDSKQAQIDAINEENEARENAINLEKEQYELERLRNQRTEYVYSGKDKGFIYQTDTGAIRDQEQAVKEAEDQIRIADIEKEISLLEKKKEVLEEQQDAISEQIDRVDEYYEQLISNTESYWDAQIDGAEETKSRWEELQELQEEMEMNARLLSIGISQEDIENLSNDELLERVREKYLGILSDIYAGNKEMLSSLSDLTGIDVSALPSFLQDTQGYMDILSQGVDFANLNDSLGIVIDQFANVAAAAGQMTGSVIGSTGIHLGTNTDTKTSAGTGDVSFIDAVKQLENESVPVINNVADAFAGEESSEDSSQSIVGSVNKAKAAIAGSSSGKKDSSEGSEGNGEDSGSLLEAMAAQSQAALDEETGIPAQIQKWQELNNVLSAILSNLMNIAAVISTMNATETSINSGSPLGPALAKGGVSHGTRNAMVSEYNQLETIIHKNGTYEITSSPTLTDLSPGDQVLNNSQTLALIRKKREASARGTNGVFLGDTHSVLSSVPELQLHNTILDNSLASMASMQLLGNDNKNSLINVSIGDVILENVQNADTLSKQIVMRLPTQIKQELSKRG